MKFFKDLVYFFIIGIALGVGINFGDGGYRGFHGESCLTMSDVMTPQEVKDMPMRKAE